MRVPRPDTSRTTDLTQSPQLEENAADKSTGVLLIISSASRWTPRSRTTVTGWMTSSPSESVRSMYDNLHKLARLPNHCSSVLSAFSYSRRDEHQSRISVMLYGIYSIVDGCCQFQRSGQIGRPAVIGGQVMADKVAYEDFYDVFGIGNEF